MLAFKLQYTISTNYAKSNRRRPFYLISTAGLPLRLAFPARIPFENAARRITLVAISKLAHETKKRHPRMPLIHALVKMERVMGIEPTSSAWKAEALPLCYTRIDAIE